MDVLPSMKVLFVIAVSVVGFASGVFWGYGRGATDALLLDAIPQGVIGTEYYKRIQPDDSSGARGWFGMKAQLALEYYVQYQDEGIGVLSRLHLSDLYDSRQEYVERLIDFRKEHSPAFTTKMKLQILNENVAEGRMTQKEYDEYRDILIRLQEILVANGVDPESL